MEHQKTKICRVCQQEKPRADFYKNKAAKDGLESLCKKCKTEQSRANRSAKKTDTIQKNNHPVDLDEMVRQVFEQSGHPDQYKALEEAAFQAFRTPAMHMIAIVHGTV